VTTVARPARRVGRGVALPAAALVAGSLAVAGLSLLWPWALAFDPWAWLVWGRETGRLALDTTAGPSWKPLPVLFTTPLALAGDAAPALWLVIARAGGLLALAGTFALAARLAGRWAGIAAAGAMAFSPWWAFNTALGNSEGMLAAAVLWAVVAHLAGRRRAALVLVTAASLMRPEAWPFVIGYGAWLWRTRPEDRRAVVVAGAAIPLLWFGPDVLGAGGALDASHTARGVASEGSAKLEPIPALAVLADVAAVLTWPALVAAVIGAVAGGPSARAIAWLAAAWVAIVAAMTLAGYAGNPRYLVASAALGTTLAGVGAVHAATTIAGTLRARTARGRTAAAGALVLCVAVLAVTAGKLGEQADQLAWRARVTADFEPAIAAAGGRDRLVQCSRVRTNGGARTRVAWQLDLPSRDLDGPARRPAVVIRSRGGPGDEFDPPLTRGFLMLVLTPHWQVAADCGDAPQIGLDEPLEAGEG
jgi:hypothetical protein